MNGITKIYLVTNCFGDPNKVYVGKEKSLKLRKRKNDHTQTYGKQIEFDFIDQVNSLDHKDWKPLETFYIRYFRFLGFEVLNKNEGGGGPSYHSEESKQKIGQTNSKPKPKGFGEKISKINKGKTRSEELKIFIKNIHTGRELSQNSKDKISRANKGKKPKLGIKHSLESKNKISNSNKGQKRTEKTCENISKGKKGKPSTFKNHKHTEESKNKTSLSNSLYPVKCLETNIIFRNVDVASREMNISPTSIREVCKGTKNQTRGYTFKYIK